MGKESDRTGSFMDSDDVTITTVEENEPIAKHDGAKRQGGDPMVFKQLKENERLDRGVVNSVWNQEFLNYSISHQQHSFLDHCPLLLEMGNGQRITGDDNLNLRLHGFWNIPVMGRFENYGRRQPVQCRKNWIKSATLNFEVDKKELYWEQRARANWLKNDDCNSNFSTVMPPRGKGKNDIGILRRKKKFTSEEVGWAVKPLSLMRASREYGSNVSDENRSDVRRILEVGRSTNPEKYLGLSSLVEVRRKTWVSRVYFGVIEQSKRRRNEAHCQEFEDANRRLLPLSSNGGAIIRHKEGQVMGSCMRVIQRITSAFAAEATAAIHSMDLALDLGFSSIIVEGDSRAAITKLFSDEEDAYEISALIYEGKRLAQNLHACRFRFSLRSSNIAAHQLETMEDLLEEDRLWVETVPRQLEAQVAADSRCIDPP
ncbi:hypothetical protein F3Y22_tig00110410pilonHSYRG00150 [Hibiscus syriacus]|uniref:RNase H type-1 domain-containing protein n=1 Tax=Hibiscus syriacus TaxID=106335 RepID=A0A6A3APB7_HIBSY|nr:hypothetical protein F3Y22_tig00110410pilonHSYRG00150 [Hibiscus syriacus]